MNHVRKPDQHYPFTAREATASAIADAAMGRKRVIQTVTVSREIRRLNLLRFIVQVVPDGETRGDFYDVGERTLAELRKGWSPAELELEPLEGDDEHSTAGIPSPEELHRSHLSRVL